MKKFLWLILVTSSIAQAQTITIETLNDVTGAIAQTNEAKIFSENFDFKEVTFSSIDGLNAVVTGKADFTISPGMPRCGKVVLIISRHQDYRMIKTYTASIDTSAVSSEKVCQDVITQILRNLKY